jgi:hypothetical protein
VSAFASARALPEAYLEGVRYQLEHGRTGHQAYLLGEVSRTGWWHYYLVALLVKNTPGFLLALVLGIASARSQVAGPSPVLHAAVPAALVALVASASRIQIGERYVLPAYPYLILLAAAGLARISSVRWGRAALAVVLALHVVPALLAARAGYLAYFNPLAGGTVGGHRVLLDSNLDWGQDLPRLAEWMRAAGVGRVQLAYAGADDPGRFGIAHDDLPGVSLYPQLPAERPFDGVVAVSPNLLFGLGPRFVERYVPLRERPPDARAGVFFVFFMGGPARLSAPVP